LLPSVPKELDHDSPVAETLIDAQDLALTAKEISAKALTLVQSIGTAETEEAGKAIAAKARAYFKRAFALQPQLKHESVNGREVLLERTGIATQIACI
jgi:hypothetical protein